MKIGVKHLKYLSLHLLIINLDVILYKIEFKSKDYYFLKRFSSILRNYAHILVSLGDENLVENLKHWLLPNNYSNSWQEK